MIHHNLSIDDLFPEHVICVASHTPPKNFELLPDEREATSEMSAPRLREFAHGRYCARLALAKLGYPDCALPTARNRAPEWPAGVVGSITHCHDAAAAAVARSADAAGLGLDVTDAPLDADLLPLICRAGELPSGIAAMDRLLLAKLLFSAKESVFKCIYAQVRRFVDFTEVSIQADLERNVFTATPHANDLPHELFERLNGRFKQSGNLIVTAVTAAETAR